VAKQCIYCRGPLLEEEARFCSSCGRSQTLPSSSTTVRKRPIKVKLPPKEFAQIDSFPPWPEPFLVEEPAQEITYSLPDDPPEQLPISVEHAPDDLPEQLPVSVAEYPAKASSQDLPAWLKGLDDLQDQAKQIDLFAEKTVSPTEWPRRELYVKVWEPYPVTEAEAEVISADDVAISRQVEEETSLFAPIEHLPISSLWPDVAEAEAGPIPANDVAISPQIDDARVSTWAEGLFPATNLDISQQPTGSNLPVLMNIIEPLTIEPAEQTLARETNPVNVVEDMPTMPLILSEIASYQPDITVERASTPAPKNWGQSPVEDIDDLPTVPLLARIISSPLSMPSAAHMMYQAAGLDSLGSRSHLYEQEEADPKPPRRSKNTTQPLIANNSGPLTSSGRRVSVSPNSPPVASLQAGQFSTPFTPDESRNTLISLPAEGATERSKRSKHHGRVVAVLVLLLVLLIVGGLGGFYVIYQPFTLAANAQPKQAYQNAALGFSLSYPQDWQVSFDPVHQVANFADSSQTGQVRISTAAVKGQTSSQYGRKETSQFGITGAKTISSATFGGSVWQGIQGTVLQSGSTYTIVLYITQHRNDFYAMACLAPPAAYKETNETDFTPLRASFQFF
jgi:hypothetical protein